MGNKGTPEKKRGDTKVSLAPLEFEDALRGLMATGEHTDEEIEAAVTRAREDQTEESGDQ